MATIKLSQAIESLNAKAKFQYSHDKDDDTIELIDTIIWEDGNPTGITNDQIATKLVELHAEFSALQYQRDRIYPTWQEQMDMQYHDQLDGTTTWKDTIAKVKSDNPKPE